MSRGALSRDQFPVYEVGDPTEHDTSEWAPHYRMTQYGKEDQAHPSKFGFDVAPPPHEQGLTFERTEKRDVDVPLDKAVLTQDYVYEPHARNLATVPAESFHPTNEYDPVDADELPDGRFYIHHGHHRTVAARLRGDATVRAKLGGRWHG